jgi:signal transduction histidine kinase
MLNFADLRHQVRLPGRLSSTSERQSLTLNRPIELIYIGQDGDTGGRPKTGDTLTIGKLGFEADLDALVDHLETSKSASLVDGLSLLFHLVALQRRLQDGDRRHAALSRTAAERLLVTAQTLHDARNLLTLIRVGVERLQRQPEDCQTTGKIVQQINKSTADLNALFTEFLFFSRSELRLPTPRLSDVDAATFLRHELEAHRLQSLGKGLEFETYLDGGIPALVVTDPQFLRRILGNVIGNSIKYTAHGSIRVSVGYEEPMLVLTVADSGCGVDPEVARFLFRPYEQAPEIPLGTNLDGVGLGLFTSRQLASSLGGDLTLLECEEGSGATFRIRVRAERVLPKIAN